MSQQSEVKQLRAENERLRAALQLSQDKYHRLTNQLANKRKSLRQVQAKRNVLREIVRKVEFAGTEAQRGAIYTAVKICERQAGELVDALAAKDDISSDTIEEPPRG